MFFSTTMFHSEQHVLSPQFWTSLSSLCYLNSYVYSEQYTLSNVQSYDLPSSAEHMSFYSERYFLPILLKLGLRHMCYLLSNDLLRAVCVASWAQNHNLLPAQPSFTLNSTCTSTIMFYMCYLYKGDSSWADIEFSSYVLLFVTYFKLQLCLTLCNVIYLYFSVLFELYVFLFLGSYPELSVFPPLQSQYELHTVRSMPEQKWKTIKSFWNIFNASKAKNSFKIVVL